ncbi:hypothetical protein [Comamonas sp.]|uniref:hypothetical protein n=1 Tax=Comamonas sp. TaxID=34028 RepID=UPI0025BD55ED|nr:hypothetical protein [Comamonas sp.]
MAARRRADGQLIGCRNDTAVAKQGIKDQQQIEIETAQRGVHDMQYAMKTMHYMQCSFQLAS